MTRSRMILGSFLSFIALFFATANVVAYDDFTFETTDEGVKVVATGKPLFFFQTKMKSLDGKWSRASYVHPLYGLDGQVLTEDFPEDHRHHRGVFWAWHQLRWQGKQMADPWVCDGVSWLPPEEKDERGITIATKHWVTVNVVRDWTVQHEGEPLRLVREDTRVYVGTARTSGVRSIDFKIKLRALKQDVAIGGSEDDKGYGGFSPRLRLPKDLTFTSQKGRVEPAKTAVEGGAWMDFTGTFDDKKAGVTVLVHPSHPDFPPKWILRAQRSMQNVAWPGRKPVTLSTEKDLVLRYQLLVHRGQLTANDIEAAWKTYAKPADN